LQVHPGSLIFLDTQEQFLQHPYFISRQIAKALFYTVGVFSRFEIAFHNQRKIRGFLDESY